MNIRIHLASLFIAFSISVSAQMTPTEQAEFELKWEELLDRINISCNGSTDLVRSTPSEPASIPIPGYGLNGKITLGMGDDPSVFNYGNGTFAQGVDYMNLEYLRFPGGTTANSFNMYSTVLRSNGPGVPVEREYFLNLDGSSGALLNFSSDDDYLLKEGSFQRSELMDATEADDVVGMENIEAFLQNHTGFMSTGMNPYQETQGSTNRVEENYLYDFISLTQDRGIKPLLVLRMIDPFLFVLDDDDYPQVSPVLLAELNESTNADNVDNSFICTNFTEIQDLILRESLHEVRRQMIKFSYEYLVYFHLGTDQAVFNAFLNDADIDSDNDPLTSDWAEFVQFIAPMAETFNSMPLHFELGNEFWLRGNYKVLPPAMDGNCQFENPDPLPNAALYTAMCTQSFSVIEAVFPEAKIGVVGGNRNGSCEWMTAMHDGLHLEQDQFDAWVMHYYSRYETGFGINPGTQIPNSIVGGMLDHPLFPTNIHSPGSELLALMDDDENSNSPNAFDKPYWITEFNVKESTAYPINQSWFDLMVKFNLLNQYLGHSASFRNNVSIPLAVPQDALDEVFNDNNGPNYPDIEIMLMQTLYSNGQSSLALVDGQQEFDYTDQGLMAVIMDRLTADGYDRATPMVFRRGDDLSLRSMQNIAGDTPSCGTQVPVANSPTA